MNRIMLKTGEIDSEGIVHLSDRRAAHVINILRLHAGDEVRIGVINGAPGKGKISQISAKHVTLTCRLDSKVPERPALDIILALPRPLVMKRLWTVLASLGVSNIVVTNASKVERYYFDTQWLSKPFYDQQMVEGLEQSGDTLLPEVRIIKKLRPFIEQELDTLFPGTTRIFADTDGDVPLHSCAVPRGGRILLAIGPEGGWTGFEREMFKGKGFVCASMGSRILRADVAAIAAVTLSHALLDGHGRG